MLLFLSLLFPFLIIFLLLTNSSFYKNRRISAKVYRKNGKTLFIATILLTLSEMLYIGFAGDSMGEALYVLFLYVVKYILVAIAQVVALGYSIFQWKIKTVEHNRTA